MLHIRCLLHDFNVGQKRITYSTGLGDRLVSNSLARPNKGWPKYASGYGKSGGRVRRRSGNISLWLSLLRPLVLDSFVDPVNLSNIALVALFSVSFALALRLSAEKVASVAWMGGVPVHAEIVLLCHGKHQNSCRPDENTSTTFTAHPRHKIWTRRDREGNNNGLYDNLRLMGYCSR
jgi:hypothetical protein